MSNFTIEILEPTTNYLNISTSFIENINNIEIERSENYNLEIVNTEKILWSDLPDNIPMSKIGGNLHYSRIDGLEAFVASYATSGTRNVRIENLLWGNNGVGLEDYLNQYEFDCGIPSSD